MKKTLAELKIKLDRIVLEVEQPSFIQNDPVGFLYAFDNADDKEIAAFFASYLAWGRRDIVLAKVSELLARMGNKPGSFVRNYTPDMFRALQGFKHRTFNDRDIEGMVLCLKQAIGESNSLEPFFMRCKSNAFETNRDIAAIFQELFLAPLGEDTSRLERHISTPEKGSSCKRFWLFLRWMIRRGVVDGGLWTFLKPSELVIPLDVHVGNVARALGLLSRTQNDFKAVQELMKNLRMLDKTDPVKYDFALFGIGVLKIPV